MASTKQLRSVINSLPKRYRLPATIILMLIIISSGWWVNQSQSDLHITPTPTLQPDQAMVARVVDGDTVTVLVDGQSHTIRLIGVDTPEVVDPRQPVQCFGQQASDFTHSLLDNQIVRLVADPTQDNQDVYGRWLRYVYLANGTFVNLELIRQGYAFEYTYKTPYQYQAEFKSAQQQARLIGQGLWSSTTCNGQL